ncbi:hypothetical protein [uncultured Roseobacter sp.]|uniref:hypothetical protein n=1 Tax=uncultured Roseobacter sp. TaxID=114847 RepID=UPI002605D48F|nr:hypothetical protein [uncultured Roseobacter sp.]
MEFEPISSARMLALMAAGGLFAAAGLYMMLRPKPQGVAKLELFGLKFESSSAGLLVFIIGAAFLAVTLFVPEKSETAQPDQPVAPAPTENVAVGQQPRPSAPGDSDLSLVALPAGEVVKEVEANDTVQTPNILAIGQRVTGAFDSSDTDWFALRTPEDGFAGHEIMLRHISGSYTRVDVFNAREEYKGYVETRNGAEYLTISSDFPVWLYLKVYQRHVGGGEYELAVLPPK